MLSKMLENCCGPNNQNIEIGRNYGLLFIDPQTILCFLLWRLQDKDVSKFIRVEYLSLWNVCASVSEDPTVGTYQTVVTIWIKISNL